MDREGSKWLKTLTSQKPRPVLRSAARQQAKLDPNTTKHVAASPPILGHESDEEHEGLGAPFAALNSDRLTPWLRLNSGLTTVSPMYGLVEVETAEAKKVSVVAKGKRARSVVFSGNKEKTATGLTKAEVSKLWSYSRRCAISR